MTDHTRLDEDELVAQRRQRRRASRYHAKRRAAKKRLRHRAERYQRLDDYEERIDR